MWLLSFDTNFKWWLCGSYSTEHFPNSEGDNFRVYMDFQISVDICWGELIDNSYCVVLDYDWLNHTWCHCGTQYNHSHWVHYILCQCTMSWYEKFEWLQLSAFTGNHSVFVFYFSFRFLAVQLSLWIQHPIFNVCLYFMKLCQVYVII